jgi:hypothetical protein
MDKPLLERLPEFLEEANGQLSSIRLSLLFTVAIEIGLVLPSVVVVWAIACLRSTPVKIQDIPYGVIALITSPVALLAGIKMGQKFGEPPGSADTQKEG